ncbi:MAG TPA: MarR family transcriptional regulator [Thermomicrobiales bacterium]|nr:MarR family transcriptional regulator [Thermomicrobiales bacterium]
MARVRELSPAEQAFIEAIGRYFERLGVARIGGRLFGLCLVYEEPLSLDDIAELLMVSRASVSTNARAMTAAGLIEPHSLPGDRRDYYVCRADIWPRRLERSLAEPRAMRDLAEQGLNAIAPDNAPARERLEQMVEFMDFFEEEVKRVVDDWRHRVAGRKDDATNPPIAKRDQREVG